MAKPQPQTRPADPAPQPPKAEPQPATALPEKFQSMDSVPQDGRTVRLWFGTGTKEMTAKYFLLARWRRTRVLVNRRWKRTGHWVHPHSNMPIGFTFTAWQPVGQVTQDDIDASNAAVAQENARREAAAKARLRKADGGQEARPS